LQGTLHADLDEPKSIDRQATHEQVATLKLQSDGETQQINAFCLNQAGHLVAACGDSPGQIQIADEQGNILQVWNVDVKPEAVSVASDGTILVGGEGKLFRFDAEGKLLHHAASPHAESLMNDKEKVRKEAISQLARSSNSLESRIVMYQQVIKQLETKAESSELNEQEEQMLKLLPKTLEVFVKQAESQAKDNDTEKEAGPSEEAIQEQIKNLIRSKMKISSISSDDGHVFVATRDIVGYGYVVWKLNQDFSDGKVIVEGLRGCCGQMDVQCCKEGLFVAENSRHRVVRFDAEGKQTAAWGKQDRTGVNGFSSCCNPMNVCFNAANDVFTAESGTGRIKRFDADGEFVSYVGDVDLVPGCKNVSIAVSPDSDRVYMLDLTRNHIVVMQKRDELPKSGDVASAGE